MREFDEKGGPPQQVASWAAWRASKERDTVLWFRCAACQTKIGEVRRTGRGLLFRAPSHLSPKGLGLLGFKEIGKQANEGWVKGIDFQLVDLIKVDLGPHPRLLVHCQRHGKAVVTPDQIRAAVAANKRVLTIRLSVVLTE